MMKTAATVLQEMMVRLGDTPHFECTSQSGPAHSARFEYRCTAHGVVVVAKGGSKKEAKQEAARRALRALASTGLEVPPPYGQTAPPGASPPESPTPGAGPEQPLEQRNAVALLRDLCEEYGLGSVDFVLVGDTGPPHLRHFTMRVAVGGTHRVATSTTKKAARAQAARLLYTYLKDNLSRLTGDIDESAALARAHERAMERYEETRGQSKPHFGQCIADYHKALLNTIQPEALSAGRALLAEPDASPSLLELSTALGLTATMTSPSLLAISPSAPPLLFASPPDQPHRAEQLALQYLTLAIA